MKYNIYLDKYEEKEHMINIFFTDTKKKIKHIFVNNKLKKKR